MQFSDATTMNLSMLTSNFYSLAISILFFGQKASWLYLVGFFCIPIAIALFTIFAPKTPEIGNNEDESSYINSENEIEQGKTNDLNSDDDDDLQVI